MSSAGRALIVADAHLGSRPGDVEAFLSFLERHGARAQRLVFLGDLFDLWLGFDRLQSDAQRRVLGALRGLRARGARLYYVEGNRDYFLAEFLSPDPFESVAGEGLDLDLGGALLRFEHGDRINRDDRNYQLWRRLSRSSPVRRAFKALPAGAATALSRWLERRMRTTNAAHRARLPEALCRERALEAFRAGAQRLFLGHFHRPWLWETSVDGKACRAQVVPAWLDTGAGWVYDPGAGLDALTSALAPGS